MKEYFEMQKRVSEKHAPNVEFGDNPMFFYHAINGIIEEASEALKEDTRYKGIISGKKEYKSYYNHESKVEELTDIFRQIIMACLYSNIMSEKFEEVLIRKLKEKI